jgi:multiple sugar transport system permease protein
VDGCTRLHVFWRAILPLSWSGICSVATLVAIGAWGEYFGTLILAGPDTMTAPVAVYAYVGVESQDWSAMAAGGLIVVVPILLATMVAQRGLLRGLTAAAVKG